MTTFAHIETGQALDPRVEKSQQDYYAKSSILVRDQWTIVVVPDDTLHGRPTVVNPDGSASCGQNPVPPPPVLSDLNLTKDAFIDYCSLQFGNAAIGPARFGAIIVAARASTDPTVAYAISKYDAVGTVVKTQAQKFFQALRAANLPAGAVVTTAEINAIVNNWPQG